MHAPFHIRPAVVRDAASLAELGPRTFRETFGTLLPEAFISARMAEAYAPAKIVEDLTDPAQAWFVADSEGGPVGFLCLRQGVTPACVGTPSPMELQRLYVTREWHGRGPGLALLAAGQNDALARKAKSLWLLAWEANPRALAFYGKQGFEVVGAQNIELSGFTLPHLVMNKRL